MGTSGSKYLGLLCTGNSTSGSRMIGRDLPSLCAGMSLLVSCNKIVVGCEIVVGCLLLQISLLCHVRR